MTINKDIINTISDQLVSEVLWILTSEFFPNCFNKTEEVSSLDLIFVFSNIAESATGETCRRVVEDVIKEGVKDWSNEQIQHCPNLYHNVKYERVEYLTNLDFNYIADELVIHLHDLVYKIRIVGLK